MSAKIIVPEAEGYGEAMLESMLRCTLFPSSLFDQPIPVRGKLNVPRERFRQREASYIWAGKA